MTHLSLLLFTGIYKPQIKIFEVDQLSLKFERHIDAQCVQFQFLADDFSKMVLLRADRMIETHASFGLHSKIRIPKFGRDITYHAPSCDLFVSAATNEVYRLNLDQGRFLGTYSFLLTTTTVGDLNIYQTMK
jgi:ribosome biogenesis protein ENP2